MRPSSVFYFLAGSSEQVIEDCPPAERNYHTAIGGFVLITAVVASMSGGYALYTVFHSVPAALLFGLFWGCTIGAIDRFIVMTIDLTQQNSRIRTVLSALLRVVLAVFVAIVVARPLELRIFEPEIAAHLGDVVNQQLGRDVTALQADLERRQQGHESTRRLAEEQEYNAALTAEHATCLLGEEQLRAATHGECDGTAGTLRVGVGPICKLKRQDHEDQKARCAAIEERKVASDEALVGLRAENERVFAELRAETEAAIAATQRAAAERIAAIEAGDTGSLLTRLEALSFLAGRNDAMSSAIGFVTLLFVLIETLPVGLKLMTTGRGTYSQRIDLDEREATKRHRIERKHRERARIGHRQAIRDIAEAVREQQRGRVIDGVTQGVDIVTDDVNLELRRRTEVTSRDLPEARSVFPTPLEPDEPEEDAERGPDQPRGPRLPRRVV